MRMPSHRRQPRRPQVLAEQGRQEADRRSDGDCLCRKEVAASANGDGTLTGGNAPASR